MGPQLAAGFARRRRHGGQVVRLVLREQLAPPGQLQRSLLQRRRLDQLSALRSWCHVPSTTAAVVATWDTIMTNGGQIVEASYQATLTGNTDEACGAGLSNFPGVMSAWGSENGALAGDTCQQILSIYYPGEELSTIAPPVIQSFTASSATLPQPGGA